MFDSNVLFFKDNALCDLSIAEQGLYYNLEGTFSAPEDKLWKVCAVSATEEISLGICIKVNDLYIFKKKIARKTFKGAQWRFVLKAAEGMEVLAEDDSFDSLDQIERAYLVCQDDGLFRVSYRDQ